MGWLPASGRLVPRLDNSSVQCLTFRSVFCYIVYQAHLWGTFFSVTSFLAIEVVEWVVNPISSQFVFVLDMQWKLDGVVRTGRFYIRWRRKSAVKVSQVDRSWYIMKELCPPCAAHMASFPPAAFHSTLVLCCSRPVLRNPSFNQIQRHQTQTSSKRPTALYGSNSRQSGGALYGMRDRSTLCARGGGRQQTKMEQESLARCICGSRFRWRQTSRAKQLIVPGRSQDC